MDLEIDKSRKHSVDVDIVNLIDNLNNNSSNNYSTTSSCSGRIVVYQKTPSQKQHCKWIKVSHETVCPEQIIDDLKDLDGETYIKYEPFILHCCAKTNDLAQKLLHAGISSGFRESGISLGKRKTMVAIRSSNNMDVPLTDTTGRLLVSNEYIRYICEKFNEKMSSNAQRRAQFELNVMELLSNLLEK